MDDPATYLCHDEDDNDFNTIGGATEAVYYSEEFADDECAVSPGR